MHNIYRGVFLGAAIGDALGMPYETSPPSFRVLKREFARPNKMHPNSGLKAGCYTDDTQIALLASELLVSGNFTPENYALKLKEMHINKKLRFPDATIISACRHMMKGDEKDAGCNSTTSGCVPLAVPFALAYSDYEKLYDELAKACSVTHTNRGAIAGAVWLATLIRSIIDNESNPLKKAHKAAFLEDETLGMKISDAVRYAKDETPIEAAIVRIGNDVSVYQTIPMAVYFILKYGEGDDLLYYAAQAGGNTDTLGFICGAWLGAEFGVSGLSEDLMLTLENREAIETMANRLYQRFGKKD
ncbi:ADP-ribosylation/Crystallin J1 [Methanolacinia petrolearia DSM 11571]|uniref:ADP-ribosylation/Crystallin J1 n=1 Tax=Methanolacinia petrolearia (strain DSM 11571 / OCM 486 / SEBR 4847) TaxID=679926 RepID=E1RFP5_METP4|nr:ADP-ribosylglycohydrolase family protein [Methanolacinia petrolearia]ADN37349.1 ADP-ribosylation/Crystallin J1 [Methanolacinia petrolearia DSM 11571]